MKDLYQRCYKNRVFGIWKLTKSYAWRKGDYWFKAECTACGFVGKFKFGDLLSHPTCLECDSKESVTF